MANTRENPYVGPRAFTTAKNDQKKFAGRDRDITAVYRLLIAERIVLLFSPSGAGKSSLVNAGLLPRMIDKGFKIFPVVRVNFQLPSELAGTKGANRYVMSMLHSLEGGQTTTSNAQLSKLTIDEYLRQHLCPENDKDGEQCVEPKSFLIFDQFEEILTIDPNDDKGKREFFAQLGEALEAPEGQEESRRWALFAVREDYVAALDPYLRYLPTRLTNRYRLDLLDDESAKEAVCKPAQLMNVSYTDEAVEHLINELRSVRIQRPDGSWEPESQLGRYVEPVQLQVVCHRLWEKIDEDDTITKDEVTKLGSVDESLAGYYADKVADTSTAEEINIPEKDIRTWFDTKLITPSNIRSQVMWEKGNSGGLDNKAISYLEKTHLIRRESRRGIRWLELAHDRLIKPVRDNNREWFEKNLSPLQRQAMLWATEGEPERLLLRDVELTEAEAWANDKALSTDEQKFLEACIDLRERLQAEASRKEAEALAVTNRRLRIRSRIAISAAVIAGILAIWASLASARAFRETARADERASFASTQQAIAQENAKKADNQAKNAALLAQKAQEQSARSLSLNLALNGSALIDQNPPLAALLSIESLKIADQPQAEQNIRDLLGANHPYLLSGHSNAITHTIFSPDEQWLITADGGPESSGNNSVRIWNMGAQDPSHVYAVPKPLRKGSWTALAISPDNQWLVLGDRLGRIVLYEFTKDSARMGVFSISSEPQVDQQSALEIEVTALAFGQYAGEDWLAVGSADGTVALVDFSEENLEPLLSQSFQPEILILGHGTQKVNVLAFSRDGRWLAGGSNDFQIRIWDVERPESTPVPHLQDGEVESLLYSDEYLVSYGNSNRLYIYNAQQPTNTAIKFEAPTVPGITALAFDPANSQRLVFGQADGTIQFFDIASLSTSWPFTEGEGEITHLAFDREGQWLISVANDQNVRLWSVDSFDASGVASPSTILKTFDDEIISLQFSPNGRWLTAGSADRSVALWDLRSGLDPFEPAKLAEVDKNAYFPSFSPDGKWLAAIQVSVEDINTLKVWSAEKFANEDHMPELSIENGYPYAFSPNSKELAVAFLENEVFSLGLYDLENPDQAARLINDQLADISFLAFSPGDANYLIAHDNGQKLYIWNTSDYNAPPVVHSVAALGFYFQFSSTGRWLAAVAKGVSDENDIYLFDLENPNADPLVYNSEDSGVYDFTFSPDERWFGVGTVSGATDGNAYLWDLSQSNPQPVGLPSEHTGYVNTLAFDPSSQWLATGDDAGIVRIWEVSGEISSSTFAIPSHDDWVTGVMFSTDGNWFVSNAADGSINLWIMDELLSDPGAGYYSLNGHEGLVTSLVFSPKSRWLASRGVDRTIRLWDLSNLFTNPIILKSSPAIASVVTFSLDERLLLSDGLDGDPRLWHLDLNVLKMLACNYAGRNMSEEELAQYLGAEPYHTTCANYPEYAEATPIAEEDGPSLTPTPTPLPTPTATPGQACSINGDVSVNVTFVNNSDRAIDVYWIDYDCNQQLYATLAPSGSSGDRYVQGTFATHPWVFIDAGTGEVLKEFVAGTTDEEVAIP